MATQEKSPQQVEQCRCLLQGFAKNLADRLYGPSGPAWGTSFADLERTAALLAGTLQKGFLDLVLSRQAATLLSATTPLECPRCGCDTLAVEDPEPRILHTPHGDVEWLEPQRYCLWFACIPGRYWESARHLFIQPTFRH
jgi:hypothetical protein